MAWKYAPRDLIWLAAVTAAYWFAAIAGLQWTVVPGAGTAVWPAAGIGFAALVLGGVRLWPAVFFGRLLAAIAVDSPQPLWADLLIAGGTAAGAVVPALLIRRAGGIDQRLASLRDMAWLVLAGAAAGALLSAAAGVAALWGSGTPAAQLPRVTATWIFGFGVGVLVVTPVLLVWSRRETWNRSPLGWAHLIACLAAVALAGALIFFDAREHELRTWHLFPLLVWAALAFRVDGAGPAVAITCLQAIFSAIMGLGPLSETGEGAPERLLFAQQFVAAMGVTILMMAAISDERRGTERLMRTAKALAEEREALATLNESGAAIAAELDLDKVVQQVTDAGVTLSGARFGAFFYNVADQAGERFTLFTLSGAPREAFERFGHPRNTPVFAPTFNGEGVVRSDDITKDSRYGQFSPHHGMPKGHLPVRSYLAVPVRSRSGEVIGGLFFGHPDAAVFTERSEQLLEGLAGQAAIALDNARLFQAAQWEIERRRRGEEHQRLLINELNHRVKNTLATVQSIAAQTLRSEGEPEAVREAFTARLMALSAAHDVLTRQSWEGAELAQIIASAIRPFEGVRGRFVIDGPLVWLEPKSALAIAMALHELGVNAVKYGALTAEGGRVELSWRIPQADQLHLTWSEAGGPPVTPPARAGFGSRLIQRGLASELGGHAEIRFEPSGVVCQITAALGRPVAPSPVREDVFAR